MCEGQLKQLEENMASVRQEYEMKKESLKANIERIRGAYTLVYNQLKKFGAIKEEVPEATAETPVETPVETKPEEKKQEEKSKSVKKTSAKKEEPKEKATAGLTKEEIEKINKAVTKPATKDVNGNEIPEYLQQEYNK